MRTLIELFLVYFLKLSLWFRYSIIYEGYEKLNPEILNKPGGVLFLSNHPTVFVDATSITTALYPKYKLRHMIVEYMYYLPVVYQVMKYINALPVPDFSTSSNSTKKKKTEKMILEVMEGLRKKENFLIFPSGRTKSTAYEAIDGASAVHRIVQEMPDANVVLVRVKGLWGSSFSRALTGRTALFFPTLLKGIWHVFKNLIFFTPRRKVIIEFVPVPKDFPYKASRVEFNKYLENWYNTPDGLTKQEGDFPGDSLVLVSHSLWKKEYPELWKPNVVQEKSVELEKIPLEVRNKVLGKIAELTDAPIETLRFGMNLASDLGMDSLDLAEISAFLSDEFEVKTVSQADLSTVGKVLAIAAKQIECEEDLKEIEINRAKWFKKRKHERAFLSPGKTIPEVFLNSCDEMGSAIACGDLRAGILTYSDMKTRAVLLAEYIKKLPGDYIGIVLPASVTATLTILACQLAGKIPLMINWTVGPRHLESVLKLSQVKAVLSSWTFLENLQNVDFGEVDNIMVMLEDVRRELTLFDKIKAYLLSKRKSKAILKHFGVDKISLNDPAVLLFTSGTESLPKGVPLSHHNILSNQRETVNAIEIFKDDVFYGILPPFHSFGFTIGSLLAVLCGIRVAFYPDPTDGKNLAEGFKKWGVTIAAGAPTFIKGMVKAAHQNHLDSLRLCIVGAEKLPADLELAFTKMGKNTSLLEGYGITECSPVLTFTRYGKPRVGVGQPIKGVEICIVDLETHKELDLGKQGLILAKGPNVFSGYLNPGLSSPFIDIRGVKWYNTGDLGFLDSEGNLIISGRLKRFIKIGGEMISLLSLEDALMQAALEKEWIVSNEEGPALAVSAQEVPGEKTTITLFSRFDVSVDEVNKVLREVGFSNLIRIHSVIYLPEIPLMGTGKIHYRKLDELLKN